MFPIVILVLRLNHKKQGKFDPTLQPTPYCVLAAFNNNTFLLATADGKILKRRVNGAHLKAYIVRQGRDNVSPGWQGERDAVVVIV